MEAFLPPIGERISAVYSRVALSAYRGSNAAQADLYQLVSALRPYGLMRVALDLGRGNRHPLTAGTGLGVYWCSLEVRDLIDFCLSASRLTTIAASLIEWGR